MMNCNMMNSGITQVMIGVDAHQAIIPPSPIPLPTYPHFVVMTIRGVRYDPSDGKDNIVESVYNDNEKSVQRGHDIGMFIIHVSFPLNILIPIILLGSGSICEWGGFSVKIENNPPALGFPFVYTGVNLNCADPFDGASVNTQLAVTTTMVGFKLGDLLGSVFAIIFDMAIGEILDKLGEHVLGPALGALKKTAYGKMFVNSKFFKNASSLASAVSEGLETGIEEAGKAYTNQSFKHCTPNFAEEASEYVIDKMNDQIKGQVKIGGGVGDDAPTAFAEYTNLNGNVRDPLSNGIADYFNEVPSVN